MCIFCAAIPATVAVGAAVRNRQQTEKQQAELDGEKAATNKLPAGPATAATVVGLLVCSVIYHSQLNG